MKPYWKVTIFYLLFGLIWILLSDLISFNIAQNNEELTIIQTLKGWFYVILSAGLVFVLTRRTYLHQIEREQGILDTFHKTVEGAHHILLNYLNQMQLVLVEAERSKDFDQEIVRIARQISREAESELLHLRQIESVTCENIEKAIYRNLPIREEA